MVIITLPAYNEEESLPLLLERVEESMGEDDTEYRRLTDDYVSEGQFEGRRILKIEPEGLRSRA